MDYPAVTTMGVVPVSGSTFELKVSPVVGFRTGHWVVVGTGGGTNPFYAQVTGKTATGLMLRNSMPDGAVILRNPAPGSDIPQCSSVAICNEPPNVSADPITRCTPDMAVPSVGEIVGLAGLTRSDTVSGSGKCARFVHRVGTDGVSIWVPDLPGATDTNGKRLAIYDTTTKTFKWLDAVTPGLVSVATGGAFTTTSSLNGMALPTPTGGTLPTGSVVVVYDPAAKAWYQMPAPPSGMVNPYLTWSTTPGAVGPVWSSRPPTFTLETPVEVLSLPAGPAAVPVAGYGTSNLTTTFTAPTPVAGMNFGRYLLSAYIGCADGGGGYSSAKIKIAGVPYIEAIVQGGDTSNMAIEVLIPVSMTTVTVEREWTVLAETCPTGGSGNPSWCVGTMTQQGTVNFKIRHIGWAV